MLVLKQFQIKKFNSYLLGDLAKLNWQPISQQAMQAMQHME